MIAPGNVKLRMVEDNPIPEFKSQEEAFLLSMAESLKGRWAEVARGLNDIALGAAMATVLQALEPAINTVQAAKVRLMIYLDGFEQALHQLYLLLPGEREETR